MGNPKDDFSKIYDQFVDRIYRFIFLKVSSRDVAEDLTSDTFLRCWNVYKNDQKGIENNQAFLYKIARNLVIDHYRSKGKAKIVPIDDYPIIDTSGNIPESMNKKSDMDNVRAVLAGLNNSDYQDVITMHYVDDLSVPEIAEIMDKSEGTVRVLLHRALKSVKDKIEEV